MRLPWQKPAPPTQASAPRRARASALHARWAPPKTPEPSIATPPGDLLGGLDDLDALLAELTSVVPPSTSQAAPPASTAAPQSARPTAPAAPSGVEPARLAPPPAEPAASVPAAPPPPGAGPAPAAPRRAPRPIATGTTHQEIAALADRSAAEIARARAEIEKSRSQRHAADPTASSDADALLTCMAALLDWCETAAQRQLAHRPTPTDRAGSAGA